MSRQKFLVCLLVEIAAQCILYLHSRKKNRISSAHLEEYANLPVKNLVFVSKVESFLTTSPLENREGGEKTVSGLQAFRRCTPFLG